MTERNLISRRTTLKSIGAIGASALLGSKTAAGKGGITENCCSSDIRKEIFQKVSQTPFIDTHEHLPEEKQRLSTTSRKNDDWTKVLSHYINYDMRAAGMSQKSYDKLFSSKIDPIDKWGILEPFWPAVKNTGYGQAVNITLKRLYDVDELSAKTIKKVQSGYEKVRRAGFYKHILCDLAKIESCQVNCLSSPFSESDMPTLLMQDLSILGMFQGPEFKQFGKPTGIKVSSLSDWHRVIDFWFNKYAKYAVAVKSQNAYNRDINYEKVPAEKVEAIFKKRLAEQTLTPQEQKALEDHLFWYAVEKSTKAGLPVKLHTGIYAGYNRMPLSRLINNPGSATDLCRMAPQTQFVFMHICYPYYEELIAAAKHYTNANVDMCWAWIINPIAAKDFLKKYLVTAPANKILTFGGDYIPIEPVLGHAVIARNGIALALSELVEEGWFSLNNALEITDTIMHANARRIFNLAEKEKVLKNVKWG
ncbi:MAG: amidohydrolase family protein [Planctomycetota bacterium]|jgi:predicted TIM-barrel fold metal-dependent hydrolase